MLSFTHEYKPCFLFQFVCLYSNEATKPYNESSISKHQRKFAISLEWDECMQSPLVQAQVG